MAVLRALELNFKGNRPVEETTTRWFSRYYKTPRRETRNAME
jgi:hypothetical protein